MLSKRGGEILFLAMLTLVIAAVCGMVMSIAWFGVDGRLLSRSVRAMALGWVAGFPVVLLVSGVLRRVAGRFVG